MERSKCTVVSSLCQTGDGAESQGGDASSSLNSERASLKDTLTPMSSKSAPANSSAHWRKILGKSKDAIETNCCDLI